MMMEWNPEICDAKHNALSDKVLGELAHLRESMARVERQTTTTNGRVTKLEKWQVGLMAGIGTLAATDLPRLVELAAGVMQ